ncbi:hypothetical protein T4A_10737 [Trichinella pseudospiralis]|uniref:Uncharacterized protein n=1 Tax=Trichinella pseudospiralis TaxID=6337 RepID=A0A0V1DVZ7_TRIPS|nr:hypothetical protein T4A_10737 [Trichinella pseudospiralis]
MEPHVKDKGDAEHEHKKRCQIGALTFIRVELDNEKLQKGIKNSLRSKTNIIRMFANAVRRYTTTTVL